MLIGKRGDGYKNKVHLSNQLKEGVCFGKNSKLIVGKVGISTFVRGKVNVG